MGTNEEEEDDDEEITDEWKEYWLMVGGVSEKATAAIESVGGKVVRMTTHYGGGLPVLYAVCLLYDDDDDDQGFVWHTNDGEKARYLYICSADEHHDLYIHCADGYPPRFESDVTQLRLVTEGEWFNIAGGEVEK